MPDSSQPEPRLVSNEATLPEEPNCRAAKCVQLLEDDFHRQGQYLHVDDVHRVVSRLRLSDDESIAVWETLVEKKVAVDGFEQNESSNAGLSNNTDDPSNSKELQPTTYGQHNLLTHDQEIQLGRRVRSGLAAHSASSNALASKEHQQIKESGESAKAQLILSNIRLVIHWAKKHELATSIPLEDLVQEGILGLFRAIDKYDPERGFRFSTYATWWINQSISRAIQNTGRTVRVPSHMFGRLRKLRRKRRRLANRLQRFPDELELARELGWDISDVCLLLHVERDTKSLDQSSDDSGKNGFGRRLRSPIKSPDATAEQMELQRIILKVLRTLDERSRHILILRYGLNGRRPRTLEQVGEKYGVTRERIRQIEKRALEKISSGPRGALLREYADIEESME